MLSVFSLGKCEITFEGGALTPDKKSLFNIALHLAVEAGKRIPRTAFCAMFWPRASARQARQSLRQAAYLLRLTGVDLEWNEEFVEMDTRSVVLDYHQLQSDPPSELILQEFLPGYNPRVSASFHRWLQQTRDTVDGRLREAILTALRHYRVANAWKDIEAASRRYLELDSLNEEATLALAEALAMTGRKIAAVRLLSRYIAAIGAGKPELRVQPRLLRHRVRHLAAPHPIAADNIPYVGRRDTLSALHTRIELLRARAGGCALIEGPRGIGKSRIMSETIRPAALDGARVIRLSRDLTRQGVSSDRGKRLIGELLALPGALGCAPSSLAALRQIAFSPDVGNDASGEDGTSAARNAYVDALIDLIDAVSHEQPLIFVAEDIDNGFSEAVTVLAPVIATAAERAVLVLLSAERGDIPSELEKYTTRYNLRPLDVEESSALVDEVLSRAGTTMRRELRDRFITLGNGNPAVIIDLVRYWCIQGTKFQFPPSLTETIDRRLLQLGGQSRAVLLTCILLGAHCTVERILRTGLYSNGDILMAVDELGSAGLLLVNGSTLTVADSVVARHALGRSAGMARRFLHGLIAQALESELQLPDYSPITWEYAKHLRESGEPVRAVTLLVACGDHVLAGGQPTIAADIFRRAKELCSETHERFRLDERLVHALCAAENWLLALQTTEQLQRHRLGQRGRPDAHTDLELVALSARWQLQGQVGMLLKEATHCLYDASASTEHRLDAGTQLLVFAHNMGDASVMKQAHSTIAELGARVDPDNTALLNAALIFHSAVGNMSLALSIGEHLVAVTRRRANETELALALRRAAVPLRFNGRFIEARELLREALSLTTKADVSYGSLKASDMIGTTFLEEGKLSAAWTWHAKSLQWAGRSGDPEFGTFAYNLGAKIAILQSRPKIARRLTKLHTRSILTQQVLRLQSEELAIWFGIQLQKPHVRISQQLLRTFDRGFNALKKLGKQDFAAYILASVKRASGDTEEALKMLGAYMDIHRREKSPLPTFLTDLRSSMAMGGRQTRPSRD